MHLNVIFEMAAILSHPQCVKMIPAEVVCPTIHKHYPERKTVHLIFSHVRFTRFEFDTKMQG